MHDYERKQSLADFAAGLHEARSGGGAERRLPAEEIRERLEEAFGRVKAHEGHRLAVAWRIARAVAIAQGHLDLDTPLSAVPEIAFHEHTASTTQGHADGTPPWVVQVADAETPVLPLGIIESCDEEKLDAYQEVAWMVVSRLGIEQNRAGRLGARSLLIDEDGVWPQPWQLVALEDALVEEVFTIATSSPDAGGVASERRAQSYLLHELDLTRPEAESVLALARDRAIRAMPSGTEAHRAIQYHALSDLARRCALSHDLRGEVAARRLLAQTTGVTRTEPEDSLGAFVQTVRRIASAASEARAPLSHACRELPAQTARAGPLDGAEDAGERRDTADAEALERFDMEN